MSELVEDLNSYSEHVFLAVRMGGRSIAIRSLIGEEVAHMVYDT